MIANRSRRDSKLFFAAALVAACSWQLAHPTSARATNKQQMIANELQGTAKDLQGTANEAGAGAKVSGVKLTAGIGTGATRAYEATVIGVDGRPISGATLDIGGLGSDPDLRVPTITMTADEITAASIGRATPIYRASLTFPADGDWVLVVRVHTPSTAVELFTENIVGAGAPPSHDDRLNSPSRRAVLNADPSFFQRYDPRTSNSDVVSTAHAHTSDGTSIVGTVGPEGNHPFDVSNALFAILHSIGALAWISAVLILVLANRMGPGRVRTEITAYVASRYRLLAGGGLIVVAITGSQLLLHGSAGLTRPSELLQTGLGTAYLAIFVTKMALVIGSLITTIRIGRLLPSRQQFSVQFRTASVGAQSNEDMSTYKQSRLIYRLAEVNAVAGAAILGCVILLGQIHHALH